MKVSIRDPRMLASLKPKDVEDYLVSTGWTIEEEINGRALVLSSRQNRKELLIPTSQTSTDYAARVAEAIASIEIVEERSQLEIVADIQMAAFDIVRFRLSSPLWADGSIYVQQGIQTFKKARDLIASAARAVDADEPKGAYYGKPSERVQRHLKQARLGQTERGSYVITVKIPIPRFDENEHGQADLYLEPFPRQITQTMTTAVQQAYTAALETDRTGDWQPFFNAIPHGVSANLCDAVAGIADANYQNGLDVSVCWSRVRAEPDAIVTSTTIEPFAVPIFLEAARNFRQKEPEPDFSLEGVVVGLDRAEGAEFGTVKVFCVVEDKPRKVRLELPVSEYHKATRAHDEELSVQCTGDLVKEGRTLVLREPHDFSVIEVEQPNHADDSLEEK